MIHNMPTIHDIAHQAQVSTATVSHVINKNYPVSPQVRERVLRAIRELGYHPNDMARSLRTRKSRTVGMVIPDITNPFFPAVVRGVEDLMNREGYSVFVGNSDNALQKEEAYYRVFREKRVDGLVMIISESSSPRHYLSEHNTDEVPIVYVDRSFRGLPGDSVLADNTGGSYEAAKHLIAQGHRDIAIITGPSALDNARLRLQGYKKALQEVGITPNERTIVEGRFDAESGYDGTRKLLALTPRPTALFVTNGLMTSGCLRAINESGVQFPGELSLVAFDDLDWFALTRPAITAVRQPAYDLGAVAARMLLSRVSGKLVGRPRRKILSVHLEVRDSSRYQIEPPNRISFDRHSSFAVLTQRSQ
jgi:LacI family transcriptional regulator